MKKILLFTAIVFSNIIIAQEKNTTSVDSCSAAKEGVLYKTNAHASYYHDKFNGRKTASGKRFNNNDFTAAHKKFPFGTILKVTNEINKKFVIVEITDRGPFINGREIDLSKRAFMEIASNKKSGLVYVTIEILK
ncbi:septal ring lytic transglycosylase RlpA family protein [Flavobacterium ginsenosidimutans]|uniref:Probable endolytic peptidoglycan transglycosylase RlpA n=1 Tax=Flavobacterium ginsenosidimutans TaxID=687844 RepID=A0ABZ2Q7X8_9FLAO|nr:septal ring lytic transglycosylase RlpA family protein [Flavobacterium ginsenosidimutans]KAF2332893.1 septal ring lytic transglycosylase RlpA family protein [Flavobacterium ginsenosidimutans]